MASSVTNQITNLQTILNSQWTTGSSSQLYYTGGNVGIGTTTPGSKLSVGGDINFTGTLYQNGVAFSSGSSYTFANSVSTSSGTVALVGDTTNPGNSYYYGTDAGGTKGFFLLPSVGASPFTLDSSNNLWSSNTNEPSGTNMFTVGDHAGNNTSTQKSNFIGYYAGENATNAYNSNFIGVNAGDNATYADKSNFIGHRAGDTATNAYRSNFIGRYAGYSAANANNSNFVGQQAGYHADNAYSGNFIGNNAGFYATSAYNSNFIGREAGQSATDAYNANFFGFGAGEGAVSANNSFFVGYQAGLSADNANNSIFLGYNAGLNDSVNNSGGGTSILIGDNTSTGGYSNSIAIGAAAANTAANQLVVGSASSPINEMYLGLNSTNAYPILYGNVNGVGIGTTNPLTRLQVNGNITAYDEANRYTSIVAGPISGSHVGIHWDSVAQSGSIQTASDSYPLLIGGSETIFSPSGVEAMRIASGGNVGIGATTPAYKLDVGGDINFTGTLNVSGAHGASGEVLTSNGTGAPTWAAPSAGSWGTIGGTLSNQTDLQSALTTLQTNIDTKLSNISGQNLSTANNDAAFLQSGFAASNISGYPSNGSYVLYGDGSWAAPSAGSWGTIGGTLSN